MNAVPSLRVRQLARSASGRVLVVGPSLGTAVDRLWGPVTSRLEGWTVLGWDLPGHGHGPPIEPFTAGFDMADLGSALLRELDFALGGSPTFAYAGDSVGGAVGLQLALDHPGRIGSLTLLCSAARFGDAQGWRDRAALVRAEGIHPMVASSPPRWFGTAVRAAADGRIEAAVADLRAVDPEGYALVCDALGEYDVRARLKEVKVPVLAVAGAEDVATPPAVMAEIADDVVNGRLEILDQVGHLAPYEAPTAVASLLSAHLGQAAVR